MSQKTPQLYLKGRFNDISPANRTQRHNSAPASYIFGPPEPPSVSQACWPTCNTHSHWHTCKLWSRNAFGQKQDGGALSASLFRRWHRDTGLGQKWWIIDVCWWETSSCCQGAPCGPGGPAAYLGPPVDDLIKTMLIKTIVITIATATRITQKCDLIIRILS